MRYNRFTAATVKSSRRVMLNALWFVPSQSGRLTGVMLSTSVKWIVGGVVT